MVEHEEILTLKIPKPNYKVCSSAVVPLFLHKLALFLYTKLLFVGTKRRASSFLYCTAIQYSTALKVCNNSYGVISIEKKEQTFIKS